MIVAFRYARKKYREHQSEKEPAASVSPSPPEAVATPNQVDVPSPDGRDVAEVESPETLAEKKRRRAYRWRVLIGLVLPFALKSLDTTIIASALPFIAEDFDQISQLNWIISAFNLTSSSFLPFWSQITDIFGRHLTLQITIVIMTVGTAICTGAPHGKFAVLLFGRALQGVGAAGADISVRTILADRVSLREYAVNWTLFALLAAVFFSIGPVVGGYLTGVSWRWCFGVTIPVAVLALPLAFLLLRKHLLGPQPLPELLRTGSTLEPRNKLARLRARLATIDYVGQVLFLFGFGLLILAFTWAGGTYPWSSVQVVVPLAVGGVLAVAWIMYEYLMAPGKLMARVFPYQRPMMTWGLLSQRDMGILFYVNFCVGMAMFSVMYFMDLYFTLVEHKSSSDSGLALLYFLPGLGAGAYMAMFSSNVWPRQTFPALLLGGVTSAVGVTVLAWAVHVGNTPVIYGMMALTGHGVGLRMNPGSLHGLAYFPHLTAPVGCLVAFAQPFGGTITLTLMSTVFNNRGGAAAAASIGDRTEAARTGVTWAFIALIPPMWLCVMMTTFLGNVWINKDGRHEIVDGWYFWSLLTGRKLERESRIRGDEGEAETKPGEPQLADRV